MKLISTVFAQTGAGKDTGTGCEASDYVPLNSIGKLIVDGAGILLPAGMLVFFVMLMIGGVKFLMAGGDAKALDSAKSTITFSLIGIVFLVSAWIILNIIGNFILLGGTGNNIFDIQIDELLKTFGGTNIAGNPCVIGPTVN